MGLSMAETGTGRVTDRLCNLAPGFLPSMTLDAIESRISQAHSGAQS